MSQDKISTGLGEFSKEKLGDLIIIRNTAMHELRETLKWNGYTEVTTASLVNIAGSCENPQASFRLNYYGRDAHLSQSAQLQLEALVMRLKWEGGFFTVNNSFREENYDDPEAKGRRLSEFTLIEAERPALAETLEPNFALDEIIDNETGVIKYAIQQVLNSCHENIARLGGDRESLRNILSLNNLPRIQYKEALELLNKEGLHLKFGDDLGIKEERKILQYFNNLPVFITYHPASIKFFNMKRTPDGERVYSVDLLMPRLGETVGGAIREESGEQIKKQLLESRLGKYLEEKGQDPLAPFQEYWNLFEQEPPLLRGGYGIGFERFIAFLLSSNDILETIAYRTLQPRRK